MGFKQERCPLLSNLRNATTISAARHHSRHEMATSNVDGSHVQAAEHHHQLVVGGCVSKGERAPLTCHVSAS